MSFFFSLAAVMFDFFLGSPFLFHIYYCYLVSDHFVSTLPVNGNHQVKCGSYFLCTVFAVFSNLSLFLLFQVFTDCPMTIYCLSYLHYFFPSHPLIFLYILTLIKDGEQNSRPSSQTEARDLKCQEIY